MRVRGQTDSAGVPRRRAGLRWAREDKRDVRSRRVPADGLEVYLLHVGDREGVQ
jgi:hypothetical protein